MKKLITFENISKWAESKNGLIYIICISVMLKAFFLASDSLINNDGLLYISAAQEFAKGHFKEGLNVFPMPFYSLLIVIIHFLIPDWAMAARVISVLFMVFTLIPLYLLTKELFDRKAAFWACLTFALAPASNGLATDVIRDPGFIFCTAWSVYFALRSSQSSRIFYFAATAFFSLVSILFRIEGIILVLIYPVYFSFLSYLKDQERTTLLKGVLLFMLIPLFLITAYYILSGFNGQFSFNRSDEIYGEIQKLLKIEFLNNYQNLSLQLEILVQSSPYPGFKNNFAEIAKHYIPVIYFLGFAETFFIALFPLFIIPLFFSVKVPVKIRHVFVLALLIVFVLLAYYFLIKMDFLTERYISIPVLLTYPWIGAGMHQFFEYLSRKYSKKVFVIVFLLFIISPLYKCVEQEIKKDDSLIIAAKWIEKNPDTLKLRIITGDKRFLFYAGREFWVGDVFSGNSGDAYYRLDDKGAGYNEMEKIAVENKFDLLFLRVSSKKEAPQFNIYKKIKEIKGRKNISYIFSSPETARIAGSSIAE
jgi:4-amino-4-deoxy-L-arabinose transferase-like glycosyltransferase